MEQISYLKLHDKTLKLKKGSREESEVVGFFVFSHIGYFRLG